MKKNTFVNNVADDRRNVARRIGAWGFAFFAIKGVFWLIFTFAVGWYGMG